jgi:hypothetical protein
MDEQPATQPELAPAPLPPPDTSPAAKDAAIAKLKKASPDIHFDTAYNILRGDPAFHPENPEDRIYIMQHWAQAGAEKPAEPAPAPAPPA